MGRSRLMKQRINSRVFGKPNAPTIYYLLGNGGKISIYRPHIQVMAWLGFRVVAYEYDPKVLTAGEPHRLPEVAQQLLKEIKKDMPQRQVVGIYGISLGTMLGLYILTELKIQKGMFNTGPDSVAEIIWQQRPYINTRELYKEHGHDFEDLQSAWGPYDTPETLPKLSDRTFLFLNSKNDGAVRYDKTQKNMQILEKGGNHTQQRTVSGYGHISGIIRNFFRLRFTRRFFKA